MKQLRILLALILFIIPLTAQSWKNILKDYTIVEILDYPEGYWLATASHGALRFDKQTQEWFYFKQNNGYMTQSDDINAMVIANNRVWFGTNYGIHSCTLDGKDWDMDILPGDVYSNWVRGLSANSDSLFVASFTGLMTKPFSRNTYKAHPNLKPDYYQTSYTNSVCATDSIVWIGTDDGVFKYDPTFPLSEASSIHYYSKDNGFDTESDIVMCRTLCQTDRGVWIGLDDYSPSTNPNYCVGGLFKNEQGLWSKYDKSTGLPAAGIHFIHEYDQKIYAGLFHYVDGVNFNGAGLLVINENDSSWSILDKNNWHIETNEIRSFYCNESDTIVGTEEGIYTNMSSLPGMRPYAKPKWFALKHLGEGRIEVKVDSVYRANRYEIYCSQDGVTYPDTLELESVCDTLAGFSPDRRYYFKISGKNDYGTGPLCQDMLCLGLKENTNDILIVQGFDMGVAGNTYDFTKDHGRAIADASLGFDAISDEAIHTTELDMNDYLMVDWIAGMDSYVFEDNEKECIKNYLENGGKLFISGGQIQENVYSIERDAQFYLNYLKAQWKTRNAQTKQIQNLSSGMFNGLESISIDDGTHGHYNVFSPDGFKAVSGAEATMLYADKDSASFGAAALQYTGVFGDSQLEGQLVYMGFPFECIYPDSLQDALMACVLNYFNFDVQMSDINTVTLPESIVLNQNYPNPFNPSTTLSFDLSERRHVDLSIFDINGKKIITLFNGEKSAGYHTITWDASKYSSGLYVYRLQADEYLGSGKMLLMK